MDRVPLWQSLLRRLVQALLGAVASFSSVVIATYYAQYRWFPDGCFVGRPRLWLTGVGSSLEMSAAIAPLVANALDEGICFVWFFALVAAVIPTRVPLRGLVVGVLLALAAMWVPPMLMMNAWRWSFEVQETRCSWN